MGLIRCWSAFPVSNRPSGVPFGPSGKKYFFFTKRAGALSGGNRILNPLTWFGLNGHSRMLGIVCVSTRKHPECILLMFDDKIHVYWSSRAPNQYSPSTQYSEEPSRPTLVCYKIKCMVGLSNKNVSIFCYLIDCFCHW